MYPEGPVEVYKREFKRKRREEERKKKEETAARAAYWRPRVYKAMRILAFPVFAFAALLVLDNIFQRNVYEEIAEFGYQNRGGRGQRNTRGALISHMHTAHFDLRVPNTLHLNYPYYDDNKPALKIFVTPIFRIPRNIECTLNETLQHFEIPYTIHAIVIPLPWLLLISSFVIVWNKKFSRLMYSLCFLPLLLLAIVLIIML